MNTVFDVSPNVFYIFTLIFFFRWFDQYLVSCDSGEKKINYA